MKKLILALAITGITTLHSYGQGAVVFDTGGNPINAGADARAFSDQAMTTPAFGTASFYVQLYEADGANAAASSLHAVGAAVNFRGVASSNGTAGYVQISGTSQGANGAQAVNENVTLTSQTSGQVTLQIRAWASTFTTYALAVANGAAAVGKSITFNYTPDYLPASTTHDLTGLSIPSFSILVPTPEPSTIALGVMGVSALLIRRRKK